MIWTQGSRVVALTLCLFAFGSQTSAGETSQQFHVAADGSPKGDGSQERPWDLATAFAHPAGVEPGAVIWLHGGVYGTGGGTQFTSKLTGTSEKPIVVRQAPGERATVDGGIVAYGQATWFWDFEITNSVEDRVAGPEQRPAGLELYGYRNKAINLVIHNTGNGIGFWKTAGDGAEIYGCLLWGNGHYDTVTAPGTPEDPWTRGSAIYAQNEEGTRYIRDVISFRNFTTGMKAYTEGAHADGFHFEGNVAFSNGDWNIFGHGGKAGQRRLKVLNNYAYRDDNDGRRNVQFGYKGTHYDVVVKNNVFVGNAGREDGAFCVARWTDADVTDNMVVGRAVLNVWVPARTDVPKWTWDKNSYFGNVENAFQVDEQVIGFNQWKQYTGFDSNSTYSEKRPEQPSVFVRPNLYDPLRANLIVFNWGGADAVPVDLSGFLAPGDKFQIRDAQNFFAPPVLEGEFVNGESPKVPLNLTETASIPGLKHFLNRHTSRQFGVYVVTKVPAFASAASIQTLPAGR